MNDLSAKETAFFENVDLDPALVGPVIGQGAQSIVRDFNGGNEVVKIPRHMNNRDVVALLVKHILPQNYDATRRQIDLCETYFSPYMAPTRIQSDAKRQTYCLLQQKVTPLKHITPQACKSEEHIRDQMSHLMELNGKLQRDKHLFLDTMGYEFKKILQFGLLFRGYMNNVVLDGAHDNVTVIDTGLLPLPQRNRMSPYLRAVLAVQRFNASLFGLSFDGKTRRKKE